MHRHEVSDDEFQAELESTYRDVGAGSEVLSFGHARYAATAGHRTSLAPTRCK